MAHRVNPTTAKTLIMSPTSGQVYASTELWKDANEAIKHPQNIGLQNGLFQHIQIGAENQYRIAFDDFPQYPGEYCELCN